MLSSVSLAHLLLALISATHALLYKKDYRAAMGWIVACFFIPFLGSLSYYLFGINRIKIRARKLGMESHDRRYPIIPLMQDDLVKCPTQMPAPPKRFARLSDQLTFFPVCPDNKVHIFEDAKTTYEAMLTAIAQARVSVWLTTYIFSTEATGRMFIKALSEAHERGVEVKVLIDGVGARYSWPRAYRTLKKRGLDCAEFLPPSLLPLRLQLNLRNHRKLLIVDGETAFTGGMNISGEHYSPDDSESRVHDLHFAMNGPIVAQMESVFADDWHFCTHMPLTGKYRPGPVQGQVFCRGISEGPNEKVDKLSLIYQGMIGLAQQRILIMTPYFIPNREMISALHIARMRGIEVHIIVPQDNNLPFVKWASQNMYWELLLWGIKLYFSPPPFKHSKIFLVDDCYAMVGSANLDPRSLRLNFEFNVEIFDRQITAQLADYFERQRKIARETNLMEMDGRSFPARIRDGLAWLFSPYL